jgi:hypothetical protein
VTTGTRDKEFEGPKCFLKIFEIFRSSLIAKSLKIANQ